MAIRERLIYAIDIVTDKAKTGLAGFKRSVQDAEGATGKFKAGATSAFDTVKANAGALAISGGAAIVGFGIKASQEFTKLALDAEKFALATGQSTEAASKWIEVAGDINISTEQIQGGFVRLQKAIGGSIPAVEELGLGVVTAADGSADMTETMLQAIEALRGVEDPAKRAKLASDLFGRGFADMSELVLGDAKKIRAALDDVSEAKIIDAEEVAKAKRNRETLDELKDTVEDLTLAFGETFLPVIAGAAEGLIALNEAAEALHLDDIIGALDDFDELGTDIGQGIRGIFDPDARANFKIVDEFNDAKYAAQTFDRTLLNGLTTFAQVRAKVLELTDSQHAANVVALEWAGTQTDAGSAASEMGGAVGEAADAVVDLGDKQRNQIPEGLNYTAVQEALADAVGDLGDKTNNTMREGRNYTAVQEAQADAAKEHRDALLELVEAMEAQRVKALELIGGDIAVRESQRQAEDAAAELTEVLALEETGLREAGAAIDDTAAKYLNAAQTAADYKADQALANGETLTASDRARLLEEELRRLAEQTTGPLHDALMGLIADIDAIPNSKTVNIVLNRNVSGDAGGITFRGARAHGGRTYPGIHEVLEEGPELLQQDGKTFLLSNGGGNVVPLNQTPSNGTLPDGIGGMSPRTINVNFYTSKVSPEDVVDAIRKYDRRNTR